MRHVYAEYFDLDERSEQISAIWIWAVFSQIILINLLIAMLTDLYAESKRVGKKEWQYNRVFLVDEFAAAYPLPPPLSLLQIIYILLHSIFTCKRKLDLGSVRTRPVRPVSARPRLRFCFLPPSLHINRP